MEVAMEGQQALIEDLTQRLAEAEGAVNLDRPEGFKDNNRRVLLSDQWEEPPSPRFIRTISGRPHVFFSHTYLPFCLLPYCVPCIRLFLIYDLS